MRYLCLVADILFPKLNSSYARRTRDLNKARQRIFQLEAEIEDAWKEAEKLANELDEYEASGADDAVVETAELVAVPRSPSQSPPPLINVDRRGSVPMPMTPTLLAIKRISPLSPNFEHSDSFQSASASPVTMTFVFPPPVPKDRPNDDAVSIRSSKSGRSVKSTKSSKGHASSLHAAKKRSSRASQGSLRLSISSTYHGKGPTEDDPPPMPEIPPQYMNAAGANNAARLSSPSEDVSINSGSTALHYVTSSRLASNSHGSIQFHRLNKQTSLDTLLTNRKKGSAAVDAYRGQAVDDLYVMTGDSHHGHSFGLQSSKSPYSSGKAYVDLNWDDDNEIQTVPRTPPYRSRTISSPMPDYGRSHHLKAGDAPPIPPPKDPSQTWSTNENARHSRLQTLVKVKFDFPLPSLPEAGVLSHSAPSQDAAARSSTDKPGLLQRSKTLHMLKGFTKRYSASIPPIFHGKPSLRKAG
jgi:hypothetical protein